MIGAFEKSSAAMMTPEFMQNNRGSENMKGAVDMLITYNEAGIKKAVKKAMKEFEPERITLFYEFESTDTTNTGTLTVRLTKKYFGKYVDAEFKYEFTTTYPGITKRIVMGDIDTRDVVFDMLMEDKVFIEPYYKNLDKLSIGNNGCAYWMDTLIIENEKRTKRVKYSEISFDTMSMITLRTVS
jgi:hypothetical protein